MKKQAYIFIILAGLLWGTSGIFVHFLAPLGFSSLHMTAIRCVLSAFCMAVYIFFVDKRCFRAAPKELLLFALSGLGLFGTATCYYISMQATSVSTAVVLMYTAPVIVTAYSVAFLGERLTTLKTFSMLCMLAGCCLVSGIIGGLKFNAWGIAIGFLSGISYSAYNIFTKMQMRYRCNPLSATLYCFLFAGIYALITSNPAEIFTLTAKQPSAAIPLMISISLCTCVLPYFFYTLALKELPVGTAAAMGIVEPMAATIYSVILFHEPLSLLSFIGILLILGAILLLSRSEHLQTEDGEILDA